MKRLLSTLLLLIFCFSFVVLPACAMQDDYIKIERESKHLGSRLHKQYIGYTYTITNNSAETITIDGINLKNNISGEVAYSTLKRSSLAEGAKTIGGGLMFAIPTLTLSLIGSVLLAPIKMFANTCGNIGAKQDSKRYDQPYNSGEIRPSQSAELKTLAPKSIKPVITVMYHVEGTSELKQLSY